MRLEEEKEILDNYDQEIINVYYDYLKEENLSEINAIKATASLMGVSSSKVQKLLENSGILKEEKNEEEKKECDKKKEESLKESLKEAYTIVGTYKGKSEVIDETDSLNEAYELLSGYQRTYGKDWIIQIEDKYGKIVEKEKSSDKKIKEDYGWEIQRGKEWDAFYDALELVGAEEMAISLAKAMGDSELRKTLVFIFRNWDYQSPYLK